MTETFIAHVNGSFACYQTRTGIDRAFIGCTHDTPREAITHTVERKGDTDALHLDRTGTSLDLTSRPAPDCLTSSLDGAEDSGPAPAEAPGLPPPVEGPRRPAPTGVTPPAPVGAPDLATLSWKDGMTA